MIHLNESVSYILLQSSDINEQCYHESLNIGVKCRNEGLYYQFQVNFSTWSVLRFDGRIKPRNCNSETHRLNRACSLGLTTILPLASGACSSAPLVTIAIQHLNQSKRLIYRPFSKYNLQATQMSGSDSELHILPLFSPSSM